MRTSWTGLLGRPVRQGEARRVAMPPWFGRVVLDVWRARRFRPRRRPIASGEAEWTGGGVAPR
ncbi:hypothetical protein ACP4J4_02955 [Aureimonas ureilytica]|uniref:hypothetical protein n=1 Tax=Aureimonas ureilytica TaxID=401562 RepID=UPI003CF762C5